MTGRFNVERRPYIGQQFLASLVCNVNHWGCNVQLTGIVVIFHRSSGVFTEHLMLLAECYLRTCLQVRQA